MSWRITLAMTGLVCLAISTAGLLAFQIYRQMQEKTIDELIATESSRIIARASKYGETWITPFERDLGPALFAWGESDIFPALSMPADLRHLPQGRHRLDRGDRTWHVLVSDALAGRLYVMFDSLALEREAHRFAQR